MPRRIFQYSDIYQEEPKKLSIKDPKQKAMLELLGRELKCTLADYQTAFDLSSSSKRVEQLEYMNTIVLKIAKVHGIEVSPKHSSVDNGDKSWSFKTSERQNSEEGKREKRRSQKKKKKARDRDTGKKRYESERNQQVNNISAHNQSLVW